MKVLVSDEFSPQGVEILKKAKGVEVDVKPGLPPEELRKIIGAYDGLVVRSATKVTADIIDAASKLKVIGRAGGGGGKIEFPAASKNGDGALRQDCGGHRPRKHRPHSGRSGARAQDESRCLRSLCLP